MSPYDPTRYRQCRLLRVPVDPHPEGLERGIRTQLASVMFAVFSSRKLPMGQLKKYSKKLRRFVSKIGSLPCGYLGKQPRRSVACCPSRETRRPFGVPHNSREKCSKRKQAAFEISFSAKLLLEPPLVLRTAYKVALPGSSAETSFSVPSRAVEEVSGMRRPAEFNSLPREFI